MDSAELCEQFECASAEYSYNQRLECSRADGLLSEAESSGEEDEIEVNVSVRKEDETEERSVDDFIAKGCGCLLGPKGSPCLQFFSRAELSTTRMNYHEMSATELDMLVLANLDAHRHNDGGEHARVSIDYYFGGKRTCKATFLFAHGIGSKKYKNLIAHFENNGLVPRRHGNTKQLPANTIPFAKTQILVGFIQHFATIHALPLPGRLPGQYSDEKALLLPSNMSKRHVYRQYCHACKEARDISVGRRKFENAWNELLPHIVCMKPASALCDTCQSNIVQIMRSANLPEAEKSKHLQEAEMHLMLAKQERGL